MGLEPTTPGLGSLAEAHDKRQRETTNDLLARMGAGFTTD
jgi:hypothetical protein